MLNVTLNKYTWLNCSFQELQIYIGMYVILDNISNHILKV